jgi:hypothetical protein
MQPTAKPFLRSYAQTDAGADTHPTNAGAEVDRNSCGTADSPGLGAEVDENRSGITEFGTCGAFVTTWSSADPT